MEMEIKARRWLAAWYQCPVCGAQSGSPMVTPTKVHREYAPECSSYRHDRMRMQIIERRYYTTFAIECTISSTIIAGTLEKIGPFKVCTIVHPDIRSFRKWVEMRRAELAEQSRQYMEEFRRSQEESEARLKRQRAEAALLREVEGIAYRRAHAVELAAEKVAQACWPEEKLSDLSGCAEIPDGFDDEHPF